jgi:hypothetical protein
MSFFDIRQVVFENISNFFRRVPNRFSNRPVNARNAASNVLCRCACACALLIFLRNGRRPLAVRRYLAALLRCALLRPPNMRTCCARSMPSPPVRGRCRGGELIGRGGLGNDLEEAIILPRGAHAPRVSCCAPSRNTFGRNVIDEGGDDYRRGACAPLISYGF